MTIQMLRRALTACAVMIGTAAPLAAQVTQPELLQRQLPGWSFTPGVSIAGVFDSNVAVVAPTDTPTQGDRLVVLNPSGELSFFSARTDFRGAYQGNLRRYVEVDGLDGFDQHASVSLRRRATRRLTFFIRDSFAAVATTDEIQINGVPFSRTGSKLNDFSTGLEARLTKVTSLDVAYDHTRVAFDRTEEFLNGGNVNALRAALNRQISLRTGVGAEYAIRLANIDDGEHEITFHEAGATLRHQLGEHTNAVIGGGLAYLSDRTFDETKSGPYVRLALTHEAERATAGVSVGRSFVPSFGFGGSNQNDEIRAFLHMPVDRSRAYVQASAGWNRTEPLVGGGPTFDTYRARTTVGYSAMPWLRLESFIDFTRQDSGVGGRDFNRRRAGAQLVISQPMRFR